MAYHDPRHGTKRRYDKGCRCDECRAAKRRRMAAYRAARKNRNEDAGRNACAPPPGRA